MGWGTISFRILLAFLMGAWVGYERAQRNSAAGFRTHILVAVAMAMVSLIQLNMVEDVLQQAAAHPEMASSFGVDFGRLGAQAISGIGFIGAGTILHQRSTIVGLTTAASIWVVAILGLAIGMGYYEIATVGSICTFLTLDPLSHFQDKYVSRAYDVELAVHHERERNVPREVLAFFRKQNIEINKVEYVGGSEQACIRYSLHIAQKQDLEKIIKDLYYVHPAITFVERYGY